MPTHIRPHTHTLAIGFSSDGERERVRRKMQIWHGLCSKAPLENPAPETMTMPVTVSVGTDDNAAYCLSAPNRNTLPQLTIIRTFGKKVCSLSRKIYYYFSALRTVCNVKRILISFELFRF